MLSTLTRQTIKKKVQFYYFFLFIVKSVLNMIQRMYGYARSDRGVPLSQIKLLFSALQCQAYTTEMVLLFVFFFYCKDI